MKLIVGLGNPGKEYEKTRHNIGFMLIDELKKDFTLENSTKFKGELYKKASLLLLKPHTYMNLSGQSVKAVADFYKPERIIVIHDDIALNFGALRFKIGGSSGGHNGLKSIDSLIGVDYERMRMGVGKPTFNTVDFVLGRFSKEEEEALPDFLEHSKKILLELLTSDISTISQKYSRKAL